MNEAVRNPTLRELLEQANAENPQFKPIWGFQPAFEVGAESLAIITAGLAEFDEFSQIYDGKEVNVYFAQTLRCGHSPRDIKMYDIKIIGELKDYESWIVVQGLILVNRVSQLGTFVKQGKKMLIKAMDDIWSVNVMKKGA